MKSSCIIAVLLLAVQAGEVRSGNCAIGSEVAEAVSADGKVTVQVGIGKGRTLRVCALESGYRGQHVDSTLLVPGASHYSPAVAIDLMGRVHIVCLAEPDDLNSTAGPLGRGGIYAIASKDNGATFGPWLRLAANGTSVRHHSPNVAIDLDSNSPFRNHVYVVWVQENLRDGRGTNQIDFTKSRNGGASYYVSNPLTPWDGGAGFYLPFWRVSTGHLPVSAPFVKVLGPRDLTVGWAEEDPATATSSIVLRLSLNGGITWNRENRP